MSTNCAGGCREILGMVESLLFLLEYKTASPLSRYRQKRKVETLLRILYPTRTGRFSEQSGDLPVLVHVYGFGSGDFGQTRHHHNISRKRHHEPCSCRWSQL